MTTAAQGTIDKLRDRYSANKFEFDFNVCQFIAGDQNKTLRREIVQILTGELKPRPISKCGMYNVSDLLKANFEQLQLF